VAFGDPAWAFGGVVGLVIAASLWLAARRRYRAVNLVLGREGDRGVLPGASMIAALAVVALGVGLVSLAVVIVTALRSV
jgi:putative membrane protein